MLNKKKVVAIIPARGGSKRLPKKNIMELAGKPLIHWTIESAKLSKYIDEIIITTDDIEIAEISQKKSGVRVPELRPKSLSTDTATSENVLFYSIKNYCSDADVVVLLQPTSPLRTSSQIDEALRFWDEKNALSVISVCKSENPIEWINTIPKSLSMKNFKKQKPIGNQQYRLNGAIYVYDVKRLLVLKTTEYQSDTYAYIMPNEFSFDIDNMLDFKICEFLISKHSHD
jgi:N-acylneuraminate cytidylyltransferase